MTRRHAIWRLQPFVLIGIGAFAGANLRYFVGLVEPGPVGTLVVNVLGSALLGVVLYESIYADLLASETRLVVGTGFISSFTTYSTFAVEAFTTPRWAVLYVVASYALGFAGVLAGRTVARRVSGGER